jgi:hypothetical protein
MHLIGTPSRDLPACSRVPQPSTLPRAPLINRVYKKEDSYGKENRSRYSDGFTSFQHPPSPGIRKSGFWSAISLYVCASRFRLNCWPDFTHIRYLQVHTNILAQKTWTPDMGTKTKTSIFWETAVIILMKFQYFMGTISLNKSAYEVSSGK